MSQAEPLTPMVAIPTEQLDVSPAVAEVMERAHSGAMLKLEQFEANQKSPVWHYLEEANGLIRGILGTPTNPQELSELIANKEQYRKRKAANEERFQQAA